MKLSLIICTYMRPDALCVLLDSIVMQVKVPNEIIIVDGSLDAKTTQRLEEKKYSLPIRYFMVDKDNRGLTKQRNYGVARVNEEMEIVAFLDDDIRLSKNYFNALLMPYMDENVIGVGGCTTNEATWYKMTDTKCSIKEFCYDGYKRSESLRFVIRKLLKLAPTTQPGLISSYSHERATGSLPPSGKCYEVDFMMGGIASFRKSLFEKIGFSHYFEGYGLYEDKDFTLRAGKHGKMIVNTQAQLEHLHDPAGRPNKFYYGKMVVRNGWYVWQVAVGKPSIEGRLKWNLNVGLLIAIRIYNIISGPSRMEALTESAGRLYGWMSLLWDRPRIEQ